jgi:hypothetical protein
MIDISDLENPFKAGSVEIPHNVSDVAIVENYAYLAADMDFYVFDISDPAHPVEVGMVITPSDSQAVVIAGDYAYVADWWGGLRVIDISDPADPLEVGGYFPDDYATTVTVGGSYAYLTGFWYGLWVVDISDPHNPHEVSTISIPRTWVAGTQDDYAYIVDGGELKVIDFYDLAHPAEVGSRNTPDGSYSGFVEGSFIVLADGYGGLLILKYTGVKDAAQATITSDHPNPSLVGEPFTVTVRMDAAFGIPSGEVTVAVEGKEALCSAALVSGTASCQVTLDAVGNYTVTASYAGDNYFLPSSATATHVVVALLPTLFYLPLVGAK